MSAGSQGSALQSLGTALEALIVCAGVASAQSPAPAPRVRYVVEARQLGPVGYRDPIGVMSPDGEWLAFTSGGRLRFMHTAGGSFGTSGSGRRGGQIAWLPDSRHIAALQVDDAGRARWWLIDAPGGARRPLWNGLFPKVLVNGDSVVVDPNRFREVAWSSDGAHLAGVLPQDRGPALLWTGKPDGRGGRATRIARAITSPTWMPNGTLACLIMSAGRRSLSIPCGRVPGPTGIEAHGSLAFSPDGATVYYGAPNAGETLDLWSRPTIGGRATRLTNYARDTYGPSVARDGR